MLIQISDLVNKIISNPAPVLFLDTCAILDIMNTPFYDHLNIGVIETAIKLIKGSDCDYPEVWLVITEDVEKEWRKNSVKIKEDSHKQIDEFSKRLNRFDQVVKKAGIPPGFSYNKSEQFMLDGYLYELSEKLLLASNKIENDEDSQIRALERVRNNQPPYSKFKDREKGTIDCVIIEHFIKTTIFLCENEFRNEVYFISSNTNDFGKPDDIKEPLKSQFDEVNLQYVTDIAWASSVIKTGSTPAGGS
ncbi:MAG: PIN domain-containing protein [Candidatus Hatepunaea meridiana]|nr:PIN domain-containing protein [Candidatus Hatepunaea meridiana]